MDCNNCALGTNRDVCRACSVEHALNHDLPGIQKRVESFGHKDIQKLIEVSRTVEDMQADSAFNSFVCVAGEEHVHFIFHQVDEVEYLVPKYGLQN